jgi:hypothetical protein
MHGYFSQNFNYYSTLPTAFEPLNFFGEGIDRRWDFYDTGGMGLGNY